ncbi:VENN motif pre-toxin domain-containing protein [Rosenbergiella epipactidis]|uniref:VENN motif pre-toxin domain-containing protein n=1 Tax=Rosenbergiella epipactidis TaxID=1544694 RepID=UPI003F6D42C7
MAHAVVNAALSLAKGEDALAGASSAVTAEAVGLISQAYYDKKPYELSEDEKQKVSALASLAAGLAGGLVGGDTASAVSGMQTGKVTVENNYLSTTEKSRQTELNYKQNLTPQEKQERDALNRKDSDSDMAVYLACNKGGGDCQAERAKAKEAQDTYFNQTYLNPKEAQAGYKQIENLLESTDPNAKAVFNILDGYTQAFMTFGYTEEEARARAGTYVGSIYVLGGMSAVLSSNSLTKQFGKDVVTDAKPSGNTTPKIDTGKGTTGTGNKAGEYLEDFKPSPTPAELVQQQAGKGTQVTINTEHILNGEIKTYANGTTVGTGGHYLKDPNIKVDTWTGAADANGVTKGYISVRDPATGKWVQKKAETTFFPEHWSKRQTEIEIKSAFENSKQHSTNKEMWTGTSSNGMKMEGYYKKPDGIGATAWPIYSGK